MRCYEVAKLLQVCDTVSALCVQRAMNTGMDKKPQDMAPES